MIDKPFTPFDLFRLGNETAAKESALRIKEAKALALIRVEEAKALASIRAKAGRLDND